MIGLPTLFLVTFLGLNYSGFCFEKMRYLSKEEKIRAVFKMQNNRSDLLTFVLPLETNYKYNENNKYIRYNSFEEFLAENPDCCHVNPGGPYGVPPSSFWDRIFGYDSGDVIVIDFKVRYLDEKGNRGFEEVQFENFLTNCGKVR
jgi:hypothetical protein